jgi:hypothetical protein
MLDINQKFVNGILLLDVKLNFWTQLNLTLIFIEEQWAKQVPKLSIFESLIIT